MNVVVPLIFISIFIGFFIFILGFLFTFIGDSRSFTIIFWIFVPMFLIIPIVFFGIFFLSNRFSGSPRSKLVRKEREAFRQSLSITESLEKGIRENPESFCTTCGAIVEFNERYCPKCGSTIRNF
jgi:hypothetical protein